MTQAEENAAWSAAGDERDALRKALQAFLHMHPIYLACTLGSLDEGANTGNRLAAAIAQARRALGEN